MLAQIVPASDSKADAPVDQGAAGLGQGRTGLAHLMLGSKAEQVVRLAKIPVTIVKH